jgi:hypothetical protein
MLEASFILERSALTFPPSLCVVVLFHTSFAIGCAELVARLREKG